MSPLKIPTRPNRFPFVYNGSFSLGTEGWEGSGGTIEEIESPRRFGLRALQVAANGSNVGVRQAAHKRDLLVPGQAYLARAHVRGTGSIHLQAAQHDENDNFLAAPSSGEVVLSEDMWKVCAVSFTAHASAHYIRLHVITWGDQNIVWQLDGAMLSRA